MQALLVVSSSLTGAAVLLSYLIVFAGVGGFPSPPNVTSTSYLDSPYWLGVPKETIVSIVVLQGMALVGYLTWLWWIATASEDDLTDSLLTYPSARVLLLQVFLLSSCAWPFAAYYYMLQRTVGRSILACLPLWAAAGAIILLIGGTFEAKAPPAPTIGILLLGTVVVLADGVGWAAVCIKSTL